MKLIRFYGIIILILMISITCFGFDNLNTDDEIKVYINNNKVSLDMCPYMENNRTMVPMRGIFEALNVKVEWDENSQTVTAIKNNIIISIVINSNIMIKNDEFIELEVPAKLINDSRTYIPLRAISEALGCIVKWDEDLLIVNIVDDSNIPDGWYIDKISYENWFGYYYFYRESSPEVERGYFSDCSQFSEGLAVASKSSRYSAKKYYGYIDEYGYFIIPDIYTEAGDFKNGIATVKSDFYPYPYRINTKGECVDNIELNANINNDKDLEIYEDNGLFGYKDINGNVIIEATYTEAREFSDGLALVKARDGVCTGTEQFDGFGYINTKGELITHFDYYYMSTDFKDGCACVYDIVDNIPRAWYIDKSGNKLFTDKTFVSGCEFSEGLAVVQTKGNLPKTPFTWIDEEDEFTYINRSGEYATKIRYDYAESFVNGKAKVIVDGDERYINNKFEYID